LNLLTQRGKILNWSLATSAVEYTLDGRGSVDCLDFNSSVLVNGRKNEVEIWDIAGQKLTSTLVGHSKGVNCVELVDKTIVSGSFDSYIKVWDIETTSLLHDFDGHLLHGSVNDIQYDPERNLLVSSGSGRYMFLWDMRTHKSVEKLELDKKVSAVNCMKMLNGNIFWNTRDPVVHVWDI
jgi:WD40 repeat protein